jgi:D-aminoacyl-tRNA deacylase
LLGLIQRVSEANVIVDGEITGQIERGLLLLLGVQKEDTTSNVSKLALKVFNYRVFPDENGHMNLSLKDIGGGLLIVPQFTIAADTKKGLRPSFSSAASPIEARVLFEEYVSVASELCPVQTGVFGADMKVSLVNDGPVTFMLNT